MTMSVTPCRNRHRCRAPSSVESSDIHGHLGVDVFVNGRCRRRSPYCWPGRTLARQSDDARPRDIPPVWIWVGGRVSAAGAGDESGHDVGGVPVEGSASAVVAHGGGRLGVRGGFLYFSDPNHQHLIAPGTGHCSMGPTTSPSPLIPPAGSDPEPMGAFGVGAGSLMDSRITPPQTDAVLRNSTARGPSAMPAERLGGQRRPGLDSFRSRWLFGH